MTRKLFSLALASVLSCGIAFATDSNYTTEGKEKMTRSWSHNEHKYLY
ncbi:hypothetical protein [Helicobacter sp.]|nr:hypothetical protein [Helicobacter sp.]MBD5165997.1 hypothetical protein [Helicobacter sp.]